ncbi:bifunctional UDP-3-O-[3-hydroxymyristoyl] N-acetylglucosamine deacetylase/3-hydroxyacyl-ACP dehydratase [Bacteroidales bacterium]|nr:bifunctional UDP-3-O-[3-hydroxymyristoyl] N-acetylglucosamine deacetylase/3-hydroxyacyl-ACP dehydratase [Bacteroidales bacterium]
MHEKQKTLKASAQLKGKGLHTGQVVTVNLLPAPENHGIKFQRVDIEEKPIIEAWADYVAQTSRGTVLDKKGVVISTIEHLLASITGLDLDNVLIEVDGPEVPILDGSSAPYVKAIKEVGIVEQEADREYYEITERITFTNEEKGIEIIVYPDEKYSIDVLIDYNSKVLNNQYASLESLNDFESEISDSRTFVFLKEVEFLFKNNLIKGGDLQNAIVIMENAVPQKELDRLADLFNMPHIEAKPEGILNNLDLRHSNEPARHKLLDIVGDLTLVGKRIKGKVFATRPGHWANTELAKQIRKKMKTEAKKPKAPSIAKNIEAYADINKIMDMIPHRSPFLLVDKIIKCDEKEAVGIKNVTLNEPFFTGHFPEEPVMPGVLQVEAMAQTGCFFVLDKVEDPKDYTVYFSKIDKCKFKKKVVPGDTLVMKTVLTEPIRRGMCRMIGQAFVNNDLACEVEILAQMVKTS